MKIQTTLKAALIAGVGLTGLGQAAMAADSGATLTPMIGGISHDDESRLKESGTVSLGLGYQFANPFGVEFAYLKAEPEHEELGTGFDLDQFRLDALYHFRRSRATQPFLLLGVGHQEISSSSSEAEATLFNAGVGIKRSIKENVAFRGDIRAVALDDSEMDDSNLDAAINLGIQWLFGASSASAPKPAPKMVKDSDSDGVKDDMDSCPNTPAGLEVDATGCQLKQDDDNDGVLNSVDECPSTKAGAKVDDVGCYATISEDVTVSLNVTFANNSAELVSGSDQIRKVARFMREYPQSNVVIEGHTDSQGAAAYNQNLSQQRAESVVEVLIGRYGIDASRITAVGYGETTPVASNDTAEGRATNRRVSAVVKATVEKIAE